MKTEITKRNVLVNIDQIEQITKHNEEEHRLYFISGRDMLISDTTPIFFNTGKRFVEVEEICYPYCGTGPG